MTYLRPDVIDDEVAVAEAILAATADRIPGWQPSEGHITTAQAEAVAVAVATAITAMRADLDTAYLGFARRMLGLVRAAAGVASTTSTWTANTVNGVLIPGGTPVRATNPDGLEVVFVVAQDTNVPAGVTSLSGVELVALEAGPEPNGAFGEAINDELVEIDTVTLDQPASGGSEEEDLEVFLNKASDRAQRQRALPITPGDHAAMALDVPGVARAFAVNRRDPATAPADAPGHIEVYAVDVAGLALGPGTRSALEAYYTAEDLVTNVTVHVVDPPTVPVTIDVQAVAADGIDPADLEAQIRAAITALLDRAEWDADTSRPNGWAKKPATELTVYRVAAAIDDLPALRSITAITINGGDLVALPGPLTMPVLDADDLTVTVTA